MRGLSVFMREDDIMNKIAVILSLLFISSLAVAEVANEDPAEGNGEASSQAIPGQAIQDAERNLPPEYQSVKDDGKHCVITTRVGPVQVNCIPKHKPIQCSPAAWRHLNRNSVLNKC